MAKHQSPEMQRCIEMCQECHTVCLQMIGHCLEKGGKHAEPDHIRLLIDCSEICLTSANFMLRGSELHTETCRACSVVCERCADDCERMADDAMMRECAETCRRCARSCAEMAGAAVHA